MSLSSFKSGRQKTVKGSHKRNDSHDLTFVCHPPSGMSQKRDSFQWSARDDTTGA